MSSPFHPIIILNGPSSSGKSTIARAIQHALPHPTLHLDHDAFTATLSDDHFKRDDRSYFRAQVLEWMLAINQASRALYDGGYGIIVDCLLGRWDVLLDMIRVFGEGALFVGLRPSAEELERREKARGDRPIGMAVKQNEWVHAAGIYDLELDTGQYSPEECAQRIIDCWENPPFPSAFAQIKAEYEAGEIDYNFFKDAP